MAQLTCKKCGTVGGSFGFVTFAGGYICKHCLQNKSPYVSFYNSRAMQVNDVVAYLKNREEYVRSKRNFISDISVGDNTTISVSLKQRKMLICKGASYEIIDLADITGFQKRIEEEQEEIYKATINGRISYSPKQYKRYISFYATITTKNLLLDNFDVSLNANDIEIVPNIKESGADGGFGQGLLNLVRDVTRLPTSVESTYDPMENKMYADYMDKLTRIEDIVFGRETETEKSKTKVVEQGRKIRVYPINAVCPFCTATTKVLTNGCCEYCDSFIGEMVAIEVTEEEYKRMMAINRKRCNKCAIDYNYNQVFCTKCGSRLK